MSHTPGPWKAEPKHETHPHLGYSDIVSTDGTHVVCFGHDYDEYGGIENPDDSLLLAAAPDMLAALKVLYANVEDCELLVDCQRFNGMALAEEAIAKAEVR